MRSCVAVFSIISSSRIKKPCVRLWRCIFQISNKKLLEEALTMFYELRDIKGLKKLPSTSELIDWIRLLLADELEEGADIAIEQLSHPSNGLPPMIGALIKNEADISLLQRLGFTLSRK